MTHPIPNDTITLGLALTKGERQIVGRLAFAEDRSVGSEIRRLIGLALRQHYPTEAMHWEECRRRRKTAQGVVMLLAGMVVVYASAAGQMDVVRAGRNGRRVRDEIEWEADSTEFSGATARTPEETPRVARTRRSGMLAELPHLPV